MSTSHAQPSALQLAFQRYFKLRKQRDEPTWARFVITSGIAIAFPSFFMAVASLYGAISFDARSISLSYLLGFCIAFVIHGAYRLTETLLSSEQLDRLNQGGWRSGVFFSTLPIVCVAVCMWAFSRLAGWWMNVTVITPLDTQAGLSQFLFVSLILSLVGWYLDFQRRRRQALQLQATEAQLLRLQAQIEPHFLFNSLAAVQSLIKPAPDQALQMLEHFTDYLRASLNSLRNETCALNVEMQAVRAYLSLMQIRMDDRLQVHIDVSPEAQSVQLPPLLLQPLVENAIVHGLEAKPEGGQLWLSARVVGAQLQLQVRDNGLGSAAKQHRARPGHGLALSNIRDRLATRYGERAQLLVSPTELGCTATITLPLQPAV